MPSPHVKGSSWSFTATGLKDFVQIEMTENQNVTNEEVVGTSRIEIVNTLEDEPARYHVVHRSVVISEEDFLLREEEEEEEHEAQRCDSEEEEIILDPIFENIRSHNIVNTFCHSQLRNTLQFYEPDQIYFSFMDKVSVLNLRTQEITENIIPRDFRNHDKEVSFFKKSKKYFLWSWEGGSDKDLYCMSLGGKSNQVWRVTLIGGYQFNGVAMTKNEDRFFTAGQSDVFTLFHFDETKGFESVYEYAIDSYANDVKISPNERYVAVVTDYKGFFVFEYVTSGNFEDITLFYQADSDVNSGYCDMCDFNCDSTLLVVANYERIIVFNVITKEIDKVISTNRTSFCRFSPVSSNTFIYSCSDGKACLVQYDLTNKTTNELDLVPHFLEARPDLKPKKKNGLVPICSMAFSNDGIRVFLSFSDGYCYTYREGENSSSPGVLMEGLLLPKFRKSKEIEMFRNKLIANVAYSDIVVVTMFE